MKIALLTDLHIGPHSHLKKPGWDELSALDAIIVRFNEAKADVLLDLGDRIADSTRETDLSVGAEIFERLSRFSGPRYHLVGNHDVNNLDVEDNARLAGQSMDHRVIDLGAVRLVLWQPSVKIDTSRTPLSFPPAAASLSWLIEALNADDRPAIVASHLPLSGHSQIGNFYFENNAYVSTYSDHAEVRAAVEATGKVAIWLAGHVHRNTVTNVGNIQHITIQSFTERFTTYPEPAAAFGLIEIGNGEFTLEVFGRDPFFVRLPFRPSDAQPWLKPMPPLGEVGDHASVQARVRAQLPDHN